MKLQISETFAKWDGFSWSHTS